jgi:hypothetical protein
MSYLIKTDSCYAGTTRAKIRKRRRRRRGERGSNHTSNLWFKFHRTSDFKFSAAE